MNVKNKQRFAKLSKFLTSINKKNFDLEVLVEFNGDKPTLKNIKKACAAGYCFVLFPKTFVWKKKYKNDSGLLEVLEKLQKFFGISRDEAEYFFYCTNYKKGRRGPISVAKRIEKFLGVKNESSRS